MYNNQAMESLTELMRVHPSHPALYRAWLTGVLPLVADAESSVQQKCLDYVEEIIFDRVIQTTKFVFPFLFFYFLFLLFFSSFFLSLCFFLKKLMSFLNK